MLDYQDIKMCISHMERKDLKEQEFYSGGCNCIMQRFVHHDDTTYNLSVFITLTGQYDPIICFNKSELQKW